MNLHFTAPLPDSNELAQEFPVNGSHRIKEQQANLKAIVGGSDSRLMMIVGPCSAWPFDAVKAYADRLTELQEEVKERLQLVMRCYIQKPRTTTGWSGPLNQPDPLDVVNISKGIRLCVQMMHEISQQLPIADEMLFTHNADYFSRFLSYQALGARSAEDMEHRFIASGLDMPVGVKNPTSGDIGIGVNGVLAVQAPHTFAHHQHQVSTSGNPHAHLILRGGGGKGNYDDDSIASADQKLQEKNVKHPAIVVDASHDNSLDENGKKNPLRQLVVIDSILKGIKEQRKGYSSIRGFMLESFLKNGKQSENGPKFDMEGLSITDACLGWKETETLIRNSANSLS